jgi:predicted DCC family thiol-disulfide oxidoreductase YuxK
MTASQGDNLILFDGVCNFCNSSVHFIIRHDKRAVFRFVPIQSERGRRICRASGLDPDEIQTFLVLRNGRAYARSDAVFEVIKQFGCLWRLLLMFKVVPAGLRDWIYTIIANNRYRWFGRRDTCMCPSEDIDQRFLT